METTFHGVKLTAREWQRGISIEEIFRKVNELKDVDVSQCYSSNEKLIVHSLDEEIPCAVTIIVRPEFKKP